MTAVDYVLRVVDALEALAIPYMVVGSFSSNAYGIPRSTKDGDFVLEIGDTAVSELLRALGGEFKLDPQMSFETITTTPRYQLLHRETAFMVELFLLRNDPFDRLRFNRRVRRPLDAGGREAYLPTPEDVVIQKLRWSRLGRREKDLIDARNVIAVQSNNLDLQYIRGWCDQHGTRELFEQLLREETEAGYSA